MPSLKAFLYQGRYASRTELKAHLNALGGMELSAAQQYEHDHLYECLSILDQKAAALLSFDSIIVATSTIVLTLLNTVVTVGSAFIFTALVFSGLSATLNLLVIALKWTETEDLLDPKNHFVHLLEARSRRSIYYRLAWLSAVLALLLLVVGIAMWRRL